MPNLKPERLIALRDRAGLSQSGLARLLGVGQSTIQRLEAGETRSSRSLLDLARVLRCAPGYLIGETDDPEPGTAPAEHLASEELDILNSLDRLEPYQRQAVVDLIHSLADGPRPPAVHDQAIDFWAERKKRRR